MDHKKVVKFHAELLHESTLDLLRQVEGLVEYTTKTLAKIEDGELVGEIGLPIAYIDAHDQMGVVVRHAGKLDLAIELAYYEENPKDSHY